MKHKGRARIDAGTKHKGRARIEARAKHKDSSEDRVRVSCDEGTISN